jgi:CheY-like chemotaxis protein
MSIPHREKRSVLVVSDDPDVLIFIGRLLERDGARVLFARSASQAIGIAAREYVPIDLILSNVTLPGLSGPETVNRVRQVRPGIRALYMSALTDHGVIRIDVMRRGGDDRYDARDRTLFESIEQAVAFHPGPAAMYQCAQQQHACSYQ